MQISTLKISDGLLLSWRKKHLQFWVRPKDCIFFCSLVNRTGEGTAKPSSQHSSTQLNMDLERLKPREQHNQIKNPPCINPERQDHGNSVDTQKYQEVEAQAGRKHPYHAKAKLLPSIAAARGRQMWGNWRQHNSWGIHPKFPWSHMGRSCLNENIHLAQSLCVSLAILTVLQSLVKWWLLREEAISLFRLSFPSHPGGFFIGAAGQSTAFVTAATKNTDTHPQPP